MTLPCWRQDLLHVKCDEYASEVLRRVHAYRFAVLRIAFSTVIGSCGMVGPVAHGSAATPSWLDRDIF